MANSTISLSFKITEGLKKVMNANITDVERLGDTFVSLSSAAAIVDSVANSLNQLNAFINDLTDAMAAQQVVETRLAVNMQNTMHAT